MSAREDKEKLIEKATCFLELYFKISVDTLTSKEILKLAYANGF